MRHVRDLVVAGKSAVTGGRLLGIDLPAAERTVAEAAGAARAGMRAIQPFLKRHQSVIADFPARDGHRARPG